MSSTDQSRALVAVFAGISQPAHPRSFQPCLITSSSCAGNLSRGNMLLLFSDNVTRICYSISRSSEESNSASIHHNYVPASNAAAENRTLYFHVLQPHAKPIGKNDGGTTLSPLPSTVGWMHISWAKFGLSLAGSLHPLGSIRGSCTLVLPLFKSARTSRHLAVGYTWTSAPDDFEILHVEDGRQEKSKMVLAPNIRSRLIQNSRVVFLYSKMCGYNVSGVRLLLP
ncbi:hypothetical protein BR93DRAFT_738597 [Coniochaeta sp. PMI_546]|nr:hypothetical protein BR93DRAFT_738597 [Coniochaeta sp. PMI_546]